MKCDNCGASVPRGHGACPECGVFVRVIAPQKKRGRTMTWILTLLLLAAGVAGATYFLTRPAGSQPSLLPIHVVHDRPGGARKGSGATLSEPEAILKLQRSFPGVKPECVATMSMGYRDGAYDITAVDRCNGTRLGRWRIDGKSGELVKSLRQ
jgi:hypothetical protein